jgi:cellulose biosynthesis protein BcsQ
MILTFASSKGGVGKSTTCAAIASALALQGARVLLIDLDQNRTLDRWARKAPIGGLTVSAISPDEFGDFFRKAETSGDFDHICIDLPGTREVTLFKALARSDLVVIPAQASEPDLREAIVVVKDIRDIGETTRRPIPPDQGLSLANPRHRFRLCRTRPQRPAAVPHRACRAIGLPRDVPQWPATNRDGAGEGGGAGDHRAPRGDPHRHR